jgi:hypothetical protein
MGKWLLLLVVLMVGCAVAGCGDSYVKVDHDKINKDKEAYQKKAEAALKDFDERIVDLKAKAKTAGADIKAKVEQDIEELTKREKRPAKDLLKSRPPPRKNGTRLSLKQTPPWKI